MRKRKPLAVASARQGQVIRRASGQSTYARTQQILRELGGDSKTILRDLKWERLFKTKTA